MVGFHGAQAAESMLNAASGVGQTVISILSEFIHPLSSSMMCLML